MKYFIKTFGCQMNVYDSERVGHILQNMGHVETNTPNEADIIIFNTCHIREKAAEKLFSDLGRINLVKEERKTKGLDTIIGVIGCVVQAEDSEIARRAPYVDFATGPLTYYRIPEILQKIASQNNNRIRLDSKLNFPGQVKGDPERRSAVDSDVHEHPSTGSDRAIDPEKQFRVRSIIDTDFPAVSKFDFLPENRSAGGCSFLPIQEGCNNFCTYCIVPYTRGVETSRPVEDIIAEAKRLVATGTLELNLLGQNVNSYHGEDNNGCERNIAYLLRRLAELDGLERLRYTTSYPADVDDDLVDCHKDLKKLMPYLHLPLQSGSDKILKAMNRRHTATDYLKVIEKLKTANPELGFSSDFIVGFPGESDQDFADTMKMVEAVQYIQAFSFKYSRRPGTPAAAYPNQVEEKVKKERLNLLQNRLFELQEAFNKNSIGKTMPVLFESMGRKQGQIFGRTPYMQTLLANGDKTSLNKIKMVKITDAGASALTGTIIKE